MTWPHLPGELNTVARFNDNSPDVLPFPADRWREVDPYLDEALSLSEHERDAWLSALDASNPAVADLVRELLAEHREVVAEGFLEVSPPPRVTDSSLAGQTVGPYTLIAPIGHGGMGSVWLAERSDGRFDRRTTDILARTLLLLAR